MRGKMLLADRLNQETEFVSIPGTKENANADATTETDPDTEPIFQRNLREIRLIDTVSLRAQVPHQPQSSSLEGNNTIRIRSVAGKTNLDNLRVESWFITSDDLELYEVLMDAWADARCSSSC